MKNIQPDFILRKESFKKISFIELVEKQIHEKLQAIEEDLRQSVLEKSRQDLLKQCDAILDFRSHILASIEQDILEIVTDVIDSIFLGLSHPEVISAALQKTLANNEESEGLELYCSEEDIKELRRLIQCTDLKCSVACFVDPSFSPGQAHLYAHKKCIDLSHDTLVGDALAHLQKFRTEIRK